MEMLAYSKIEEAGEVQTREDRENGGALLITQDGGSKLRFWMTSFNEDLSAPAQRGRAYRYSHMRIAQRVLLATNERLGLLTNSVQLILLISDPARTDSTVTIPIDPDWKRSRDIPDSFRFFLAVASPAGTSALPDLIDKARLQQARVTKELRRQARRAVELFIQEILDHPANREQSALHSNRETFAKDLWHEGLIIVYRLLFVLKLESSDDPARSFSFASTSLWRNTFSPSIALATYARELLERGAETGKLLETGLRTLFRMFDEGLECTELTVRPLGGALFGSSVTPILSKAVWGERAVAHLLDQLLWTTPNRRGINTTRERVHYGPLDVEDLGRVYEALLELEPGITSESMCRLRRQKLEVVVPIAQGEKYRPQKEAKVQDQFEDDDTDELETNDAEEGEDETPTRGKKTEVEWIEAIAPNRFYLRIGLGRKATGSYYTPHSFVRFLVQETLGPQVAERSPQDNPQPLEILKLKVLDPAMGSGHFLVEACRFLGDKLYEACRLCDELALAAERKAEKASKAERERLLQETEEFRQRVLNLPDPDDELVRYLPSHSPEGSESGFSQSRAIALCKRLVATHCLYGVDKNPLAVELAKLALWLESHAEGMPLTFLDHRLVMGDSLTGPFWERLTFRPGKPEEPVQNLIHQNLNLKFQAALREALRDVNRLEASVGMTLAEVAEKERLKAGLDCALLPFRIAAAAWSGGVMLGPENCDDLSYGELLNSIASTTELPEQISSQRLLRMIARGFGIEAVPGDRLALYAILNSVKCTSALPYDLTFPDVFFPTGVPGVRQGFHVVFGNPPWDRIEIDPRPYFGQFDFQVVEAENTEIRQRLIETLLNNVSIKQQWETFIGQVEGEYRLIIEEYKYQTAQVEGRTTLGRPDLYRVFVERGMQLLRNGGFIGWVVPSSFHSNEGATGVRRLYFNENQLKLCYSFENRRRLFEIDIRQKYAVIVARHGINGTQKFKAGFYLQDDEWLFADRTDQEVELTPEIIELTGGSHITFCEARSPLDLGLVVAQCRTQVTDWAGYLETMGITTAFGVELHRNPPFNNQIRNLLPTLTPILQDGDGLICLFTAARQRTSILTNGMRCVRTTSERRMPARQGTGAEASLFTDLLFE
jgi:hypothetical protein